MPSSSGTSILQTLMNAAPAAYTLTRRGSMKRKAPHDGFDEDVQVRLPEIMFSARLVNRSQLSVNWSILMYATDQTFGLLSVQCSHNPFPESRQLVPK